MGIYAQVGRRIAALRRVRRVTQEQLAEAAGIGAPYVARIENGKKRATLATLEALARALDVPVWRLFAPERSATKESVLGVVSQRLAQACDGLSSADLELLVAVAERLRG